MQAQYNLRSKAITYLVLSLVFNLLQYPKLSYYEYEKNIY